MTSLVLLLMTAAPAETVQAFERAWAGGDVAKALAHVSDNARFTFVMDPGDPLSKRAPDQSFEGKGPIGGLLTSFLPGLTLEPGERAVAEGRVKYPARLAYPWLKRLGLESAQASVEVAFASDGRISSFKLSLSPEDAARAAPALSEQNKAVVRRYYDEVNKKNFAVVDEVLLPSFVQHSMVAVSPGREGVASLYRELQAAFPDFHFALDDLIAEGNQVAVRMTGRYTHKGEFMGIPPTGKAISLLKMDVFRFVNGRCVEHWDAADRLGLLQQLGVVPRLPRWNYLPGYEGFR